MANTCQRCEALRMMKEKRESFYNTAFGDPVTRSKELDKMFDALKAAYEAVREQEHTCSTQ